MIISAASDYRAAAQRILPPFLFHYMDGGAYSEYTLRRNVEDLSEVALRQRILKNMSDLSLETTLFNEKLSMPVALAPVGLCGMYARRGEVQAFCRRSCSTIWMVVHILNTRCAATWKICQKWHCASVF